MTPADFLNLIFQLDLMSTVQTGAQWEIWLHVEIAKLLLKHYNTVCREIKYPGGTKESVDIAFKIDDVVYAVEIKVQSGGNKGKFSGQSLKAAISEDVKKIRTLQGADRRWMVCVAYSAQAKIELSYFMTQGFFTVLDREGEFVAVLINVDDPAI